MEDFSNLLNRLYFTYSHLDKMTLVEDYLAKTPDPERGYALAVMANSLTFPTFTWQIIRSLIHEKIDPVLFALSLDYVGDISDTLALMWPETKAAKPLPALSEIILTFNQLTKNDIKDYLDNLLNQASANERWTILKLGTGSLRIGISARFIKKILAHYGHRTVEEIEQIWPGLEPPYLTLFPWLEGKIKDLKLTENLSFHPLMLAHPLSVKDLEKIALNEFSIERKYDGIRIQIISTGDKKKLYSRSGEDISHTFPDLLASIQGDIVLDGELVVCRDKGIGSFNNLQQRLNRKAITKTLLQTYPAGVILYDILFLDKKDLRTLPFLKRREQLKAWVEKQDATNIFLSELVIPKPAQTLSDLREVILKENHPAVEGLMIKRNDSLYIAGRLRGYWYKWKRNPFTVDAVLMYAQRGHGKRSSFYSDYTFGLWSNHQLLTIGKAYSGFSDQELLVLDKWIRQHTINMFGPVREVEKALVFEVAFDAAHLSKRHKSGIALRFPRIKRIRWDKPAEEADQLETLKGMVRHEIL